MPAWEWNTMLYALKDNLKDLPSLKGPDKKPIRLNELEYWIDVLTKRRNAVEHQNDTNEAEIARPEFAITYAEAAIKLLRAFEAEEEIVKLQSLIDGFVLPDTSVSVEEWQNFQERFFSRLGEAIKPAASITESQPANASEVDRAPSRTPSMESKMAVSPAASPPPTEPASSDKKTSAADPVQLHFKPSHTPRWRQLSLVGLIVLAVAGASLGVKLAPTLNVDPAKKEGKAKTASVLENLVTSAKDKQEAAEACTELIQAVARLSGAEQSRLSDQYRQATAQQCATEIGGSDRRIAELRAAVEASDPALASTIERLARARKALVDLDVQRLSEDERGRLIAAGDRALIRLGESDNRIAPFLRADSAWKRNKNGSTIRALIKTEQALTEFDRRRSLTDLVSALKDAALVASELQDSKERWGQLRDEVSRAAGRQTADYWPQLRSAVDNITASDRDLSSDDQLLLLRQAEILLHQSSKIRLPRDDFGTIPSLK
ncbi:MAG: hypothetical protein ABIL01_02265 [Pseudomonadota bacterium]